ncbi:hypothetical protein [Streptomyces sp. NBC_01618]|uniref:hypothetical protein n=1 Tax=Streptomyces sp. NBC_01618 TaxID=2975900 RepID=UPI003870B96F|nr:hypothetical protein OH735_08445 [Streptomyces sp. NBC_01618]
MTADEYARWTWTALDVRRPGDIPGATPLPRLIEKHTEHADRLINNNLLADYPHPVERGSAGDALAVLALRERIRRDIEHGRGYEIRQALLLGATWSQVSAALDVPVDEARALLRAYADGQHNLYRGDVDSGRARPLGFSPEQHAAVLALVELGDDEAAGV